MRIRTAPCASLTTTTRCPLPVRAACAKSRTRGSSATRRTVCSARFPDSAFIPTPLFHSADCLPTQFQSGPIIRPSRYRIFCLVKIAHRPRYNMVKTVHTSSRHRFSTCKAPPANRLETCRLTFGDGRGRRRLRNLVKACSRPAWNGHANRVSVCAISR